MQPGSQIGCLSLHTAPHTHCLLDRVLAVLSRRRKRAEPPVVGTLHAVVFCFCISIHTDKSMSAVEAQKKLDQLAQNLGSMLYAVLFCFCISILAGKKTPPPPPGDKDGILRAAETLSTFNASVVIAGTEPDGVHSILLPIPCHCTFIFRTSAQEPDTGEEAAGSVNLQTLFITFSLQDLVVKGEGDDELASPAAKGSTRQRMTMYPVGV